MLSPALLKGSKDPDKPVFLNFTAIRGVADFLNYYSLRNRWRWGLVEAGHSFCPAMRPGRTALTVEIRFSRTKTQAGRALFEIRRWRQTADFFNEIRAQHYLAKKKKSRAKRHPLQHYRIQRRRNRRNRQILTVS